MSEITQGFIFGLGNPLLDISALVEPSLLAKYNLKANDAILADEKHQGLGEEMRKSYEVKFIAGGSCQNTMRVAQWVLSKKKQACTFMGCIGDDFYGQCMAKKASEDGVQALYRIDEKLPTGHCCVLITDAGKCRSMVASLAAANAFEKKFLLDNWSAVESARIIYSTGFHLTVCPQAIVELAEHVHTTNENKLFAFNLSAPFIMQFFADQLESVMPYVDILFCNDTEAREYAKQKNWPETETIEQVVARLANLPRRTASRSRLVLVTQDSNPVLLARSTEPARDATEDNWNFISTPMKRLESNEIVDTNGAGDAFAGGFLAQLALNQLNTDSESLKQSILIGSRCAREIIQQDGCTIPNKPF